MMRAVSRKVLGLLVATTVALAAGPAFAQVPRCAPRSDMVSVLSENYKERQDAYGLIGPRAVLEVYSSEKGGWTIIVTGADGISCVLAVGIGWERLPPLVGETGAQTSM